MGTQHHFGSTYISHGCTWSAAIARLAIAQPSFVSVRCFSSAADGGIPNIQDQVSGMQREELLANLAGKDAFENQMSGHFGTKENPFVVESIHNERVVGCPGGCETGDTTNYNDVRWFTVTASAGFTCPDCGQVFALKKIEPQAMTE